MSIVGEIHPKTKPIFITMPFLALGVIFLVA
jgi:hypothetical protein